MVSTQGSQRVSGGFSGAPRYKWWLVSGVPHLVSAPLQVQEGLEVPKQGPSQVKGMWGAVMRHPTAGSSRITLLRGFGGSPSTVWADLGTVWWIWVGLGGSVRAWAGLD